MTPHPADEKAAKEYADNRLKEIYMTRHSPESERYEFAKAVLFGCAYVRAELEPIPPGKGKRSTVRRLSRQIKRLVSGEEVERLYLQRNLLAGRKKKQSEQIQALVALVQRQREALKFVIARVPLHDPLFQKTMEALSAPIDENIKELLK